jgi:hypothetical protein
MSNWTGDDVTSKIDRPITAHGRDLSVPKDPDTMAETILSLRNEKNIKDEQIKLLKTTIFRLKK